MTQHKTSSCLIIQFNDAAQKFCFIQPFVSMPGKMRLDLVFALFCRVEEAATSEPKPLFQIIQTLINKLPNGQQVMEEVKQIAYTITTS